jgi:predicted SAM-dependent methyltransferase
MVTSATSKWARRLDRAVKDPSVIVPAIRRRLSSPPPPARKPARAATPVGNPVGAAAPVPDEAPPVDGPERRTLMTAALDLTGLGLEIGPSHRPLLPKREGYNIRVADHLDQAGLKAKYNGIRATDGIEEVDYVLTGSRLVTTITDERFDYIIASHVLEHTVCLVSFLQDCGELLKPEGKISFAIPDRRFMFDFFRDRTSLARVIERYDSAPEVHSRGSVIDHHLNVVAKAGKISWWAGYEGPFKDVHSLAEAIERGKIAAGGEYVDVHNWVFTPNHLRLLLVDLYDLGLITLREDAFEPSRGSEFYLVLSQAGKGSKESRHELRQAAAREAREIDYTFE